MYYILLFALFALILYIFFKAVGYHIISVMTRVKKEVEPDTGKVPFNIISGIFIEEFGAYITRPEEKK